MSGHRDAQMMVAFFDVSSSPCKILEREVCSGHLEQGEGNTA